MKLNRRDTLALLASASLAPALPLPADAQSTGANGPARNPFLAADKYATSHFDPAQTDAFPYPAPRGTFHVDARKMPRVIGGPVGFMQVASTSPDYMWGTSTGGVSCIDISNGGFKAVAQLPSPGAKVIPSEVLDKVLAQRFTSIEQVEQVVQGDLGLDFKRLATNVYMFVDSDNVFYGGVGSKIVAYGLVDSQSPRAALKFCAHSNSQISSRRSPKRATIPPSSNTAL
jgi:hypothetical protein